MRVLFLTLYPESVASPRYRVHQFLPYLREHGIACEVACPFDEATYRWLSEGARTGRAWPYHAREIRTRLGHLVRARGNTSLDPPSRGERPVYTESPGGAGRDKGPYDVVVLQKAIMTFYLRGMHRPLESIADRLVYDIDDAVHLSPPAAAPRAWRWLEDRAQIRKVFRSAKVTLAGNAWLASEAEAAGGRAEVLPTVVDTDRFRPAAGPDRYTVGWIGGPSTAGQLRPLAPVLGGLSDATVRVMGATAETSGLGMAQHVPWTLDSEVEALQGFSVGLMPLDKSEWTRGKCALKALQYMACGVPCIATPFGAVCDIIEDGVNGLFADTEPEWRGALERLRDPGFREQLGAAARATVVERYSLEHAAPRLESILRTVAA